MESLNTTVTDITEKFNKQMDDFRNQLKSISTVATSSSAPTSKLAEDFEAFRTFVLGSLQALQAQVTLLSKISDEQEMRSRRKMLLFHGITEHNEDKPTEEVLKVISNHLHLPDVGEEAIRHCQRLGKKVPNSKARPILVKFGDSFVKENIWRAKTSLKGTGVTISEFLTKGRHSTFMMARNRFGMSKCWTKNGFIYVLNTDGSRHRIVTLAELNKIPTESNSSGSEKPPAVPVHKRTVANPGYADRPKRTASKARR